MGWQRVIGDRNMCHKEKEREMLVEKMPDVAKPEDPIWTTVMMMRELGGLVRALCKAQESEEMGYDAEARIWLADLITQCYVLAEQKGWKRLELENDGMDRFCRKMEELEDS